MKISVCSTWEYHTVIISDTRFDPSYPCKHTLNAKDLMPDASMCHF